jgi:hypothetical protein
MLRDPRSHALVDSFANQWLKLGRLSGIVPDVDEFPDFDENLRDALQQETREFIASQLRENRSVIDLVAADYTFVNERLARHYQIPQVYGSHFRRVTFDDGIRGGLLGQASILTATSYANRTSPVLRGRWLLETMLGAPPPAPPPDVPALKENGAEGERHSVRERLEVHRKNSGCAADHERRLTNRCVRVVARRQPFRRCHWAASPARQSPRGFRPNVYQSAAGLCNRARHRVLRLASGPQGGSRCRGGRPSLVLDHHGHRQE